MKKIYLFILIISVFFVVSCNSNNNNEVQSDDKNAISVSSNEENNLVVDDFTLEDIDGNSHSLSDYKGKVVVLNFFTTWCKYCKNEIPYLQKISDEYADDVVVIGINITQQDNSSNLSKFLDDAGAKYLVLKDEKSLVSNQYVSIGIPTTVIIKEDMTLHTIIPSYLEFEKLKELVEQAIVR